MRLILIRHGRPDENDLEAPHDPPLNAEGRCQAEAAARFLASEPISRIVASPMRRALQTAAPLAQRLELDVEIVAGWAEADGAASRYRSIETLRAEGAEAWARFRADPIRHMGADPTEFRAAVLGALLGIAQTYDRDVRVAVFTHGMPINIVLSHALGLEAAAHFLVGYASITRVRLRESGAVGVASVNETGHLRVANPGNSVT